MEEGEKERILFCNIAYMRYYDSALKEEIPQNGGSFVAKYKTGYEINNFHLYSNGKYYGFVEPGFSNGAQRELHIGNIDRDYEGKDEIPDVTVVYCATSATGPVIVGWYQHATVFRNMQKSADGGLYNILADKDNAVLIDETDRGMKAPRANSDGYGFGQSQIWYAHQDDDKTQKYVDSVWKYIQNFRKEDNLLFDGKASAGELDDDFEVPGYFESAAPKIISVNIRERNGKARNACLKRLGHRCLVCGFDAKEVYGEAFEGKIHVHHITPISSRQDKYQLDPEKDLIPVCPNCHMMLHTKVDGKYLSPEELQKAIRKRYEEVK